MCTVMNLITEEKQVYTCSPKQAVIAAYAQSKGDWNTWQYDEHYGHLLEQGKQTVLCGDFGAFIDGRKF